MRDQSWFNAVALGIAAVLVLGMLLGFGLSAGSGSSGSGTPGAASGGTPATAAPVYMTIAFSPSSGLDEYFPANVSVPVNTPVTFVITNYDNGTNPVPAMFAQVVGTQGGTERIATPADPSGTLTSSVPTDDIAHTFTIMGSGGMMGGGSMMAAGGMPMLSVPVPPSTDLAHPTVVTFTTTFTQAGNFVWHCMAPCDSTSMSDAGFMTGTVTVV